MDELPEEIREEIILMALEGSKEYVRETVSGRVKREPAQRAFIRGRKGRPTSSAS